MILKDKNVFITGANRGMGKAFAEAAAKKKAKLFLLVRNPDSISKEDFISLGSPQVEVIQIDMSSYESIEKTVEFINQNWQVDVLINNAGLLTGGLIENQDTQEIYKMLQVNLTGLIHLTKALLPKMIKAGRGKIVNNASVSGKFFLPCASTYAAAKAGVVAFTESIKQELKPTGVSTLLLITGGIKTEMYDEIDNLYGNHLDLNLSAISAKSWAKKVIAAIEKDTQILMPGGSTNMGVFIGHHFPRFFQRIIRSKFKR